MVLSVRLPVDMEKRFANLVAVSKRSKSSFVIEALRRTLDDMEREYLTPQALKRHQKYLTKATEVPPSQRLAYCSAWHEKAVT